MAQFNITLRKNFESFTMLLI